MGREYVAVPRSGLGNEGGNVLRELLAIDRGVGGEHFADPREGGGGFRGGTAAFPATSTVMSPPIACAAASTFSVTGLSAASLCSATRRILMSLSSLARP